MWQGLWQALGKCLSGLILMTGEETGLEDTVHLSKATVQTEWASVGPSSGTA